MQPLATVLAKNLTREVRGGEGDSHDKIASQYNIVRR